MKYALLFLSVVSVTFVGCASSEDVHLIQAPTGNASSSSMSIARSAQSSLASSSSSTDADVLVELMQRFPKPDHHFILVLGTFSDRASARDYARKFSGGWVLSTSLTTSLTHGYYAVVAGPYATKEEAENAIVFPLHGQQSAINSYVKDVGEFLWPTDYPFDPTMYPAGVLQAIFSDVDLEVLRTSTIRVRKRDEGCMREPSYSFFLYDQGGEALRGDPVSVRAGVEYRPFLGIWFMERTGELQRPIACVRD